MHGLAVDGRGTGLNLFERFEGLSVAFGAPFLVLEVVAQGLVDQPTARALFTLGKAFEPAMKVVFQADAGHGHGAVLGVLMVRYYSAVNRPCKVAREGLSGGAESHVCGGFQPSAEREHWPRRGQCILRICTFRPFRDFRSLSLETTPSTVWLDLAELDEQHAADKDRHDLVHVIPVGHPKSLSGIESEHCIPVWQKAAKRQDKTIHRLIVAAESPEAVRERLFQLGYHPQKFFDDDHEHYAEGYAPSGS